MNKLNKYLQSNLNKFKELSFKKKKKKKNKILK